MARTNMPLHEGAQFGMLASKKTKAGRLSGVLITFGTLAAA